MTAFPLRVALLVSLLTVSCSASVVYVNPASSGPSHDGQTWATAYLKVQDGINAAVSGDEVWVAQAVYAEQVTLKGNVSLYGGFAGTETAREERSFTDHETILDGSNTRNVVTAPFKMPNGTLDGFTIRNGYATQPNIGAALHIDAATLTVRNCAFKDNFGQAVIYCYGDTSAPVIEDCTFTGNGFFSSFSSTVYPVVLAETNSNLTFRRNFLQDNYGHGVRINSTSGLIEDCMFYRFKTKNSTRSGTAVYLAASNATVRNCTIREFGGTSTGGGIYATGGAPTITGNQIEDCFATRGGGVYLYTTNALFANNRLARNQCATGSDGGGIYVYGGAPVVNNNLLVANHSIRTGWNQNPRGGGIFCQVVGATLIPTIANNTVVLSVGGGIYAMGIPYIVNNLVAYNSSGIAVNTSVKVRKNCQWQNPPGATPGAPGPDANGNIQMDPKFAELLSGDFHIQPDSPCLNIGDNAYASPADLDMDGQPRMSDGLVDIGADESDGTRWNVARRVIRVKPDGNDALDGSTWENALQSLPLAALALKNAGGGEIWLAKGTYPGATSLGTICSLYGGFAGSETERDQRNPAVNVCTLTGISTGVNLSISSGAYLGVVDGCRFTGTSCISVGAQTGGAISNNRIMPTTGSGGTGVSLGAYATTRVSGNTIRDAGNGVYVGANATPTITGNRFIACSNGVRSVSGSPVISNNVIAGSSSYGLDLEEGGTITAVNNTIYGCSTACVYANYSNTTITMANNILAFSNGGVFSDGAGSFTFKNNCEYGNTAYHYKGVTDPTGANGNIRVNPGLRLPDFADYRLQPGSAVIDKGDDASAVGLTTDADGLPRIVYNHVDIGASEWSTPLPPASRPVVYVSQGGDDANPGDRWSSAKRTVTGAIDAIRDTDTGAEVWVAEGTYPGCLSVPAFTYLYGGFAGNETSREARDWGGHPAVLDGQQLNSVVSIQGVGSYSALDGFVIANGVGKDDGSGYASGGGVKVSGASIPIVNNVITDCSAVRGSGIAIGGGNCLVSGNVITNQAGWGDAVYVGSGSTATFRSNIVQGSAGNAIRIEYSKPTVERNFIFGNAGAFDIFFAQPVINANTITDNGGPTNIISYAYESSGTFANNLVARNRGYWSGIWVMQCTMAFLNNTFVGNTTYANDAGSHNGVVYIKSGTGTATTFANNIVAFNNSGVRADSTVSFHNNDVWDNALFNYAEIAEPTGTNGNIAVDPLFTDREHGYFRLSSLSPLIDKGHPTAYYGDKDVDGNPRFSGVTIDIGACEYVGNPLLSMADAGRALRAAAGLLTPSASDARLDVDGNPGLELTDAVHIARKVSGREPNP